MKRISINYFVLLMSTVFFGCNLVQKNSNMRDPAKGAAVGTRQESSGLALSGSPKSNPAGLPPPWIFEGVAFRVSSNPSIASVPVYRLSHEAFGHMWTASKTEADRAVSNHGFVQEGVAFNSRAGGLPVHRYKISATSGYFYTTNLSEGQAGGFQYEGVAFSVQNDENPVWRYRNPVTQRYFYASSAENPYKVGVYYFDMWSSKANSIVDGTFKLYGRPNDWWGGVRDFYGKDPGLVRNTRGWGGNWDHLKPAVGFYSSEDVATMETHITQAADAGLSFFNFYWYWNNATRAPMFSDGIMSFSKARNRDRMGFAVSLYSHPWDARMRIDASQAPSVVSQLVELFASPQYLRVSGRPYIVLGDLRNIGDGSNVAIQNFLGLLNSVSRSRLGVEPLLVMSHGAATSNIRGISAKTCLTTPIPNAGTQPYAWMVQQARNFHNQLRSSAVYSPCAVHNFDERPRQDIAIVDRASIRYLEGKTDELFRASLQEAKMAADLGADPLSKVINLYAWNEWHEGGILEPDILNSGRDLNLVTEVFHLPRKHSPCLDILPAVCLP